MCEKRSVWPPIWRNSLQRLGRVDSNVAFLSAEVDPLGLQPRDQRIPVLGRGNNDSRLAFVGGGADEWRQSVDQGGVFDIKLNRVVVITITSL